MRYKLIRRPKMNPGGTVSASPYQLTPGVGNSPGLYVTKTYDENGEMEINPFTVNTEPLPLPGFSVPDISRPNIESETAMLNTYSALQTPSAQVSEQSGSRSQDGNPMDFMSMPYFAPDLGGRAAMLGQSIGRAGVASDMWKNANNNWERTLAGTARGANIAQGVLSGVSLAAGLGREIASAASVERARQQSFKDYRDRLAKERKQSFVRYEQGGDINLGNGNGTIDTSSLTGEYLYPLPKSMEDQANVEIEKGEYALTPDVVGPMEALGKKHEQGGTLVSLEEANIISDYRKVGEDFANHIREQYGIKVGPKDTYATLVDKYKNKIGLKQKYEDMEKLLARLKKNESVKDKNTSEYNKSVLSKYISEGQSEIDELEVQLRKFADVVYEAQEAEKRKVEMDDFFREGGPIDMKKVRSTAKASGLSEDEAKNILFDAYIKERRKMAEGGPTEEQIAEGKKRAELLRNLFGRQLNFSIVDVADAAKVLNPETGVNDNQELQRSTGYSYGRANESSFNNLMDLHRWAKDYASNGYNEFNTEGFQIGYNNQLNQLWSLANAGIIRNADDAKKFRFDYGFWGQTMVPPSGEHVPGQTFNSFAVDGKFGQTTATRSFYGLDVITPEQKTLLNQKGIKNFVDLFGDNSEEAKKILGKDYDKFQKLKDSGLFGNSDFVLESFIPVESVPDIQVEDFNPEISPVPLPSDNAVTEEPRDDRPVGSTPVGSGARGRISSGIASPIFPEMLRAPQSPIKFEALERHQAPRIEPVLRSADQYINEIHRSVSSQLDALGDVPDSQRAAIMANMNAIAGTNIARYINQVDYDNARQRNEADRFNELYYAQTDDKNIAERQRYEAGVLKAEAVADENYARYLDSLNSEIQGKFNVATSLNTIRSIAPDMVMLPSGQIIYVGNNNFTAAKNPAETDKETIEKQKKGK